jgi:hypothetical protein
MGRQAFCWLPPRSGQVNARELQKLGTPLLRRAPV